MDALSDDQEPWQPLFSDDPLAEFVSCNQEEAACFDGGRSPAIESTTTHTGCNSLHHAFAYEPQETSPRCCYSQHALYPMVLDSITQANFLGDGGPRTITDSNVTVVNPLYPRDPARPTPQEEAPIQQSISISRPSGPDITPVPFAEYRRETSILMHYLDHSIYNQIPSFSLVPMGNRDWMLGLLSSTKCAYYSTLSVGLSFSTSSFASEEEAELAQCYNEKAVKALAVERGQLSPSPSDSIHHLASLLAGQIQMIFYENRRRCRNYPHEINSTATWSDYIDSMGVLVTMLQEKVLTGSEGLTTATANALSAGTPVMTITIDERQMISHLLSIAWWINSVSSLTCSYKVLPREGMGLLQEAIGAFEMTRMSACQIAVYNCMSEIEELRHWKRECRFEARLSMRELKLRAAKIERSIALLMKAGNIGADEFVISVVRPQILMGYTSATVTRLHAQAMLTYLLAVSFDFDAAIIEIVESVKTTIIMLRAARNLAISASLLWPTFVTGLMSSGESRNDIREICKSAELSRKLEYSVILDTLEKNWLAEEGLPRTTAEPMDIKSYILML